MIYSKNRRNHNKGPFFSRLEIDSDQRVTLRNLLALREFDLTFKQQETAIISIIWTMNFYTNMIVQMRQMEEINMEYLFSIMRKPISKRKQTFWYVSRPRKCTMY
jgi:hypothetical protein